MSLPYVEDLSADSIRVQAPSAVVLLCGGETDARSSHPISMRDAFLRDVDLQSLIKDGRLIQAEEITRWDLFRTYYADLLLFEIHLAQITELILLFCEGVGSLAELGAFAAIEETAKRLLVVIRGQHWKADSFVKLGPILHLKKQYSNEACVLDDDELNITENNFDHLNASVFNDRLKTPIKIRLERPIEHTTFDKGRPGHIIKLIVGLIQEYGALTLAEIDTLLLTLDVYVETPNIEAYLLCAKSVKWIVEERRGLNDYYLALDLPQDGATLRYVGDPKQKDKQRRRLAIREHWRKTDAQRHECILSVMRRNVK